ncbi:nuclear transport factor 2 family protein [Micromonospora sp. R77]|uniref:nuclear transport factor 2 family protein n=1 Tax=Micromonospora sp. R77 TaxID=2925836 RepID=UPI001F60D30C|nr:nuclear transport factor 2 family protein [Micromonospora sp. R77]MCI4066895.1 nuclear transport factor 2 family protein [Micromonospora sp. R77]
MSDLPETVVRRFFTLFDQGDLDAIRELLDPDFEWIYHGPPALPWAGVYRGTAGFDRFFEIVRGLIRVHECVPHRFIAAGDEVVVLGVSRTEVLANGARYEAQWMNVFTVHDGRIVRYLDLYDTASVVEALRAAPRQGVPV